MSRFWPALTISSGRRLGVEDSVNLNCGANGFQQFDRILTQVTVAEALDSTIWVIFKKDPVAEHCDIDHIYPGVGP